MSIFWLPWPTGPAPSPYLQRHAIAKDGSCLFAAIDFLVNGRSQRDPSSLRQICAQAILADPARYNSVILGRSTEDYAAWIQHPLQFGGETEICILADHFDVAINIVSVESLTILPYAPRHGKGARGQTYLLYTAAAGGHYDAIVGADGRCLFPHADDDARCLFYTPPARCTDEAVAAHV